MNTIEKAIDNLNFIIANPFDVHLVEQKAKETLELLEAGASAMNGSAGVQWVELKDGQPLPNYDEPVIWLFSDGHFCIDLLDKDSNRNKHIFNEYRSGWDGDGVLVKRTHWHKIPPLPNESVSSPSPRTNSAGVPSSILRMNDTWPLSDVLKHLIEGTQILLKKKNYDGPDYEEMEICVKVGNEIRELLAVSSPSPLEAETADTSKVTRVEVIDHSEDARNYGRAFLMSDENTKTSLSFQDEGRTLKIFIDSK